MKWVPETRKLELSERNVRALVLKLDDPASARALMSPCAGMMVRAVEDDSPDAKSTSGAVVVLTRGDLETLSVVGAQVDAGDIVVTTVADIDHYADRPPGEMFMPTTGERW